MREYPELRAQVAAHPNAYPALLEWLRNYGGQAARRVVDRRLAGLADEPEEPPAESDQYVWAEPDEPADGDEPDEPSQQPPAGHSPTAPIAPVRRGSGRVLAVALTVVLALAVAGGATVGAAAVTRLRGPVFSTVGDISPNPVGSSDDHGASYAFGYQKSWMLTHPSGGRLLGATGTMWVMVQVGGETLKLAGIDPATGVTKWGPTSGDTVLYGCSSEPVGTTFYCTDYDGGLVAVDAATGGMKTIATLYRPGVMDTTTGPIRIDAKGGAKPPEVEVLGGQVLVIKTLTDQGVALSSLVSPDGKVAWTNAAKVAANAAKAANQAANCGNTSRPDVRKGGVLVMNSQCPAGVIDVKTGATLYSGGSASGSIGVVDQGHLWDAARDGEEVAFTSADGISWTVFGHSAGLGFAAASDPVMPLSRDARAADISAWQPGKTVPVWTAPVPAADAAYDGSNLILSDPAGKLWGVSPQSGVVLWQAIIPSAGQCDGPIDVKFLGDGTALAMKCSVATVFDLATGTVDWSDSWPGSVAIDVAVRPVGSTLPPLVVSTQLTDGSSSITRIDPMTPGPRVASMPASMPSCAADQVPAAWSTWSSGYALVCAGRGPTIHIEVKADGQTLSTDNGSKVPAGYTASSPSGTVLVALGASLVTVGNRSYVAAAGWDRGLVTGFQAAPATDLPSCPSGTAPFSLSVWPEHWLLTCGTVTVANFHYFDGTAPVAGGSMLLQDGMTCGVTAAGAMVCFNPDVVAVTSGNATTTYPVLSSYVTGLGQTNLASVTGADPAGDIVAEAAKDRAVAAGLAGQWTPQLLAAWEGMTGPAGVTWTVGDTWDQFRILRSKYPMALLLRTADWGALSQPDPGNPWYTIVAGVSFSDAASANHWCFVNDFQPADCFAVQFGDQRNDAAKVWQPSDFAG